MSEETEAPGTTEPLTLEQLAGVSNPETEKKVALSRQLPVGTYNSVPELILTLGRSKAEGREYARFFGQFVGYADDRTAYPEKLTGRVGFAVSWQYREKADKNGVIKADNMSKVWNDAQTTYRRALGMPRDEVVTDRDVVVFLTKYSVGVRFINGDQDNIGVAISIAKEA